MRHSSLKSPPTTKGTGSVSRDEATPLRDLVRPAHPRPLHLSRQVTAGGADQAAEKIPVPVVSADRELLDRFDLVVDLTAAPVDFDEVIVDFLEKIVEQRLASRSLSATVGTPKPDRSDKCSSEMVVMIEEGQL